MSPRSPVPPRAAVAAALFALGVALPASSSALVPSRAFDCRPGGAKHGAGLKRGEGAEVLTKIQAGYGKVGALKARFTQDSFLAALDSAEQSSGSMWFLKPGRMKWHYTEPEEQLFVVRDKTVWLYQVADRQVVIDNFSDILLTDLPVAFIMGLGDLGRDFTLKGMCDGPEGLVLDLAPKPKGGGKEESLSSFKLLVNPDTFFPLGASVKDVGGNVTSIVFEEVELNGGVSQSTFASTFPKGVDVQDRRKERGVAGES